MNVPDYSQRIQQPWVAISPPGATGEDDQVSGHFPCQHVKGRESPGGTARPTEAMLCSKLVGRLTITILFIAANPRCEDPVSAENLAERKDSTLAPGPSRAPGQLQARSGSIDASIQSPRDSSPAPRHLAMQVDRGEQEIHVAVNDVNHPSIIRQSQVCSSKSYCYVLTPSQLECRAGRSQAPAFQSRRLHLINQARACNHQVVKAHE